MGQIFRRGKNDWTAVPQKQNSLSPINGFRSRLDAVEIMLKINGYRKQNWEL